MKKSKLFNLLAVCLATWGGLNAFQAAQGYSVEQINREQVIPQFLIPAQQKSLANIVLWIGYLVPCSTCLGIFLYDKYYAYRSALLKEQIEMLESIWKQNSQ